MAKELSICCRFIGEELFDIVIENYNRTMKRLLPEYGVSVIEIPRLKQIDGTIISVSQVRTRIKENGLESESMLPVSRLEYLKKMYFHRNFPLN